MRSADIHKGNKMNILAFESSCDETSAAVVTKCDSGFSVKSNIVASQIETHRLYGGVVPEIASRAHIVGTVRTVYRTDERKLNHVPGREKGKLRTA